MDWKKIIRATDDEEINALQDILDLQHLDMNVREWYFVYLKVICGFDAADSFLQEKAESQPNDKIHIPTLAYFIYFAQNLGKIPPFTDRQKRPGLKKISEYFKISDKLAEKYFEAQKNPKDYLTLKEGTTAHEYAKILIPYIRQLPDLD